MPKENEKGAVLTEAAIYYPLILLFVTSLLCIALLMLDKTIRDYEIKEYAGTAAEEMLKNGTVRSTVRDETLLFDLVRNEVTCEPDPNLFHRVTVRSRYSLKGPRLLKILGYFDEFIVYEQTVRTTAVSGHELVRCSDVAAYNDIFRGQYYDIENRMITNKYLEEKGY